MKRRWSITDHLYSCKAIQVIGYHKQYGGRKVDTADVVEKAGEAMDMTPKESVARWNRVVDLALRDLTPCN